MFHRCTVAIVIVVWQAATVVLSGATIESWRIEFMAALVLLPISDIIVTFVDTTNGALYERCPPSGFYDSVHFPGTSVRSLGGSGKD
jgi:hypothetical protein